MSARCDAGLPRLLLHTLLVLILTPGTVWIFGVVWFDAPFGRANPWAAVLFLTGLGWWLWRLRTTSKRAQAWLCTGLAILTLWLTLQPSHDRRWQAADARTAWAEIHGDEVTLHDVRDFEYHDDEQHFTERWHTRSLRLSSIEGLDIALCYWGSPWMCHPILRFRFRDAPPLCFSIEARKEQGEGYSATGGLFRRFELIYIVAEEQDVIRLRSSIRPGEEVYLHATTLSPGEARDRFIEYLTALNELHQRPRWYHAITSNCTTSIRAQTQPQHRLPWDWRLIINGRLDQLLYEQGLLVTHGLSFDELRARARLTPSVP